MRDQLDGYKRHHAAHREVFVGGWRSDGEVGRGSDVLVL